MGFLRFRGKGVRAEACKDSEHGERGPMCRDIASAWLDWCIDSQVQFNEEIGLLHTQSW